MSDHPRIRIVPNGPLVVTNLGELKDEQHADIETRPTIRLCRCGASSSKPFCDGTHARIGFRDEVSPERMKDQRDDYDGADLTIHDNRGICSHAGYCTAGLPAVWSFNEPWIDADGAPADQAVEIIKLCPSGALSFSIDGQESRDRDRPPAVALGKDGPYLVTGGVELEGATWLEGASAEHYTLCRCGASKNKPFCDGSHWYVDFREGEGDPLFPETATAWHKVAELDELTSGEVVSVAVGDLSIALSRVGDTYGALPNHCPHQGGPLAEGTIEDDCLRCPWHGWTFDPISGSANDDHSDGVRPYAVDLRSDGVYVEVTERVKHIRTVSDVMAETMVNWGITQVFGMVGHSNLGLADALRRLEGTEDGQLRYFGVRHEGAAAFAASGYGKLTGQPAACLGIAGPGSTNMLTGLYDAKVDRVPVLALSGQVNTQVLGPGAFQEVDLAAAFAPVARFSQTVLANSDHAELMTLAAKTAIVERDVAHLIFPDEVQTIRAGDGISPSGPQGRVSSVGISPSRETVNAALDRIRNAERPLIVVGYGARPGMSDVIGLAETLRCPVVTTFKAKGQISDRHPLAAGVIGRSGTPIASALMETSDLLIVFGASFSNHTGLDNLKSIIQVDFDRMALGKFHPVDVPVWGEVSTTARLFNESLSEGSWTDQADEIARRWSTWRQTKTLRAAHGAERGVSSAAVFMTLTDAVPADCIIPVDVGNNTYSFGRYFECEQQTVLMSGYLGSIGFSFPAAMGAWAGAGGRKVVSISGDGGFGQYMNEFTTAVKYAMNITHVLLNNNELGKISKEQRAGEWPVWQTSLHNPNFAEYAELCGGMGIRVTKASDLRVALDQALVAEGPSLVEILTDPALI